MRELYAIFSPSCGCGGGMYTMIFNTEDAREKWLNEMNDGWHKDYLRENFRTLKLRSDGMFRSDPIDEDDE